MPYVMFAPEEGPYELHWMTAPVYRKLVGFLVHNPDHRFWLLEDNYGWGLRNGYITRHGVRRGVVNKTGLVRKRWGREGRRTPTPFADMIEKHKTLCASVG